MRVVLTPRPHQRRPKLYEETLDQSKNKMQDNIIAMEKRELRS